MNKIRVVGIDITKSVFQVCVWMVDGSVAWNRKISRQKLLDTLRQFEPDTLIAMEACSTSHFWGRTLNSMGYSVRLIPAQHVKAFVRSQKNDANDALAICETACRPGIHFVPIKTTELNRTGFIGEFLVRKLRLPDPYSRWKHNSFALLQLELHSRCVPAIGGY